MGAHPRESPVVEIRLWAPDAASAEVHVDGTSRPMAPAPGGHWTTELAPGTRYLLGVDGGEPHPDPRSGRQPDGVDGASEVYDPAGFAWSDAAWPGCAVLGRVFYEIHIGTFTPEGTLDAAIDHLDHLVHLGVDVVELMPLQPFPGEHGWGYDGVSLFAVHEGYGGPEALQRFVDAAHARGLAVCLDVVYNHFGPAGNYVAAFGPYYTRRHETPWGAAINLDDAGAEGVRAFIVDAACRWLRDFHVDALRLDAVHALVDDSHRHLLAELSDAVAALAADEGRPLALIAESDLNDPRMVTPVAEGGLGMDGQWADDVHHALHSWLTGETFGYYVDFGSAETLAKAFTGVFVHDGSWSTFREQPWGAPVPPEIERRRFVVFTQNHDQVGNRGLGDRPDARLPDGAVAGGAALLLLSPFTPLLFQGQEWGTRRPFQFFTDHEADLGRAVTEGRFREFADHGWAALYGPDAAIPDPQSPTTAAESTLDWAEPDEPDRAAMLTWTRRLIALRRAHLMGVPDAVAVDHGDDWFRLRHGPLTVVTAPRQGGTLHQTGELVAAFGDVTHTGGVLTLGDHSVAVLRA